MRILKVLFLSIVLGAAGGAAWLFWFAHQPLALRTTPLDFEIPYGSGLRLVSQQMADAGLGFSPWQFTLLARLLGEASDVKAGSYEVEQGVTPLDLLAKLTRGDFNQGELPLVDGKSFRQLRAMMDANPDFRHDTAGLSDEDILHRIGAMEKSPEGLFFPDTYLFNKHSSDLDVLRRAYRAMQKRLLAEWDRRDLGLPYASPYEALIMASLVEKETGISSDRPLVAAVFANRLRRGMMLQTDPSVIYGMGESFAGSLRKRDLLADTPYNTYTRPGLPPTPIAMPGLASLHAAMHPSPGDWLYFVSRGDGSSEFSRTLDEHNRAVAKYQLRPTS